MEAGIYDLYQLKKPNNELFSYDEISIIFSTTSNNRSFVKDIQLISALPLEWINSYSPANGLHKFIEFKKKMLSQIELLGQSNLTAYSYLRAKSKVLPYILADSSHHRIGRSIGFVLKKFNLELTRA